VGRAVRSDVEADGALMDSFRQEMDDDFNTPRALALIFDEVRALNRLLDEKKQQGLEPRAAALRSMCDTLGLLYDGYFERKKERWLINRPFIPVDWPLPARRAAPQADIPPTNIVLLTTTHIEKRIAERELARKAKNWSEADRIRNELAASGVIIEDTPGGAVWKVK
jgi:cysteinyl-tRNA synthetase